MDKQVFDEIKTSFLEEISERKNTFDPKSFRNFFNLYRGFLYNNPHIPDTYFEEVTKMNASSKKHISEKSSNEKLQGIIDNLRTDIELLFYIDKDL